MVKNQKKINIIQVVECFDKKGRKYDPNNFKDVLLVTNIFLTFLSNDQIKTESKVI